MKNLQEVIVERRSYYQIANQSPISDEEIKALIDLAVMHVPSAFNSQSARIVLLLGDHHQKLWDIVKVTLAKKLSEESFKSTQVKIESCFQCGYGTVLFYEDQEIVKNLQKQFPSYSDRFPLWSEQASGMHQYAIWLLLKEAGFGSSLQHYNLLIDAEVAKTWNIHPEWKLIAQMPFGVPISEPGAKEFDSLANRSLMFA